MINSSIIKRAVLWLFVFSTVLFSIPVNSLRLTKGNQDIVNLTSLKNSTTVWESNWRKKTAALDLYHIVSTEEKYQKVITRGYSRMPVKNADIASARRMAITLALRDAVERGYGSYVELKNLPNRREILMRASAQMTYSIVKEEAKGDYYEIIIEAEVLVPRDLIEKYSSAAPSRGFAVQHKSLVTTQEHGEINWGEKYVSAKGMAALQNGNSPQQTELLSKRAALTDAQANILETIYNIRIDSEKKLGEAVSKDEAVFFKVKGLIRGAEVVEEGIKGNIYQIKIRVPLVGAKGLGIICYDLIGKEAAFPPIKPKEKSKTKKEVRPIKTPVKVKEELFSVVVVDARETDFEPCLYPTIVAEQGMEVYSVQRITKESLIEKGMASYAVMIEPESRLWEDGYPLVATKWREGSIRQVNSRTLSFPILSIGGYFPSSLMWTSKEDNRPFLVKASRAIGKLKGTLVITQSQAQRLLELDEDSGLLRSCEVVILVSNSESNQMKSSFCALRINQTCNFNVQ